MNTNQNGAIRSYSFKMKVCGDVLFCNHIRSFKVQCIHAGKLILKMYSVKTLKTNLKQATSLWVTFWEMSVHLQAETDKCPDGDDSIYVFCWLWPFLRTSTEVGWWMDLPVSIQKILGWTLRGNEWDCATQTSYPSLGTLTCWSMWLGVIVIISDGLLT